jgi:fructose-1,6-bisphosphatase/inositol monophosphatase family enzyme
MRVGLPNEQIVAVLVELPALIANDDARGNAGEPHQRRERPRVMLTEADLAAEQQIVERIRAGVCAGESE